jgi:hypothetical protein
MKPTSSLGSMNDIKTLTPSALATRLIKNKNTNYAKSFNPNDACSSASRHNKNLHR